MPWRSVELKAKPKIGILWDNGMVTPTPPVKRALKTVAEKLRSKGYEIIDWAPDGHPEAFSLMGKFFIADGRTSVRKILESTGEPWRPEMKLYENAKDMTVYELWQLQKQRTPLQSMYLRRWAKFERLDAILGSSTPYAGPRSGQFKSVGYTGIFNILNYSSTSFPTGLYGDKDVDVYSSDFKALSDMDEVTKTDYDPAEIHGIPISLQLTCRRLEDEQVMALTEKVCNDIA
jgi:amidase